jgi:hypothetical protein
MSKWPDTITEDMWTYALRHAVNFHNASIRKDCQHSPYRLYTGQDAPWSLRDFKAFGCPTFVLDKTLQDGNSLNKWKSRSWKGVYIGNSNHHSSFIPLIYNPRTTHITPQFHVIFDEHFHTGTGDIQTSHSSYFEKLFNSTSNWMHEDKFSPQPYHFTTFWDAPMTETASALSQSNRKRKHHLLHIPPQSPNNNLRGSHAAPRQILAHVASKHYIDLTKLPLAQPNKTDQHDKANNAYTSTTAQPFIKQTNPMGTIPNYIPKAMSATCRAYKQLKRIDGSVFIPAHPNYITTEAATQHLQTDLTHIDQSYNIFSAFMDLPSEHSEITFAAYPAVDNKADTLTQSQMLRDPDIKQFVAAQTSEIKGLIDMDVFTVKSMHHKPRNARLLSSIWSYRRKRSPIGKILKYKSRLCVDGSQQELGRDYWETYAPVVSWTTVRLMLLLSSILNLKTRQVDYTQAFPQAPLNDPVYMRTPQGWFVNDSGSLQQHPDPKHHDTKHFLQLNKNLYGCKQAARNWFKYLTQGLLAQGFTQSKVDPCLYLRQDCMMVVYMDDCLIFSHSDRVINDLLSKLSETYKLEDQGRVNDYLGIRITKDHTSKVITMSQPGLIESILQDLQLPSGSKPKDTPALGILHPDKVGHSRREPWNYRSVIGKLNFLAQNTRPDISFAVHQCAPFSSQPTLLHELAVKRIGRYLIVTHDRGLILQPRKDFKLDMYVDADFAGMWHQEYSELRDCALSRTGYIITYCGCPVHWASKLQSEIALSTTESEYIALSMTTRELLPLRRIVQEIHKNGLVQSPLDNNFSNAKTSHLETTVIYEDNASCIVLAYNDGTKVHTKHISLKWHHFKDQIRNGSIKIMKVDSNLNWADILTKPLCRFKHESLRKFIMGW